MIEPTIGRIVHYHPHETAPYPKVNGLPHAATIVDVQSPSVINLSVFAPSGDLYLARGVLLLQDNQPALKDTGYAEWMPYQKGQAQKTEALQAQLTGNVGTTAPAASPPRAATTSAPPPASPAPVPSTAAPAATAPAPSTGGSGQSTPAPTTTSAQ